MLKCETCFKCTKKRFGLGGEDSNIGLKAYPPVNDNDTKQFRERHDIEWGDGKVWCWATADLPTEEHPVKISESGQKIYCAFIDISKEVPEICYLKQEHEFTER